MWTWICFCVTMWVLATMLPCARARSDVSDLHFFYNLNHLVNHSWCGAAIKGLVGYLRLYPDRLVFDCCQNPTKRPRMSSSAGVLQTLTTGCSSLWSTSKERTIRVLTCFHCRYNRTYDCLSAVCFGTWLNLRWIGASFCSWPSSREEDRVSSWCRNIEDRQAEPLCIVQLCRHLFLHSAINQGQLKKSHGPSFTMRQAGR